MSYAIVYNSRTGNTELLARAIQEALPQRTASILADPTQRRWKPRSSIWAFGQTRAAVMRRVPAFCRD